MLIQRWPPKLLISVLKTTDWEIPGPHVSPFCFNFGPLDRNQARPTRKASGKHPESRLPDTRAATEEGTRADNSESGARVLADSPPGTHPGTKNIRTPGAHLAAEGLFFRVEFFEAR